MWGKLVLATVGSLFVVGCTVQETINEDGGLSPTTQGPAEKAYCASLTPTNGTIAISGTAQFNRRDHFGVTAGATNMAGLGSADPSAGVHPASTHPIRRAEVRVTDAAGALVACTETSNTGTFTVTLPQDSQTYKIAVSSRSYNSHLHASVLNRPDQNVFYSLDTTVVADNAKNIGAFTAPADGATVLAGAFNILDQLLNANEYLVAQTASCSSTFSGCTNFNPTSYKVAAYWQVGFNPNDYFGSGGSGLSFYLPGYERLFILGGINGNTDNMDTDHFDNSVIVHEYGHFLEDTWFKSDSPGGMHGGNEILDPRLAWSEGWGDFFQAAVRSWVADPDDTGVNRYIDTMGNLDGTTQMYFYLSTESFTLSPNDFTTNAGEGNFREFAVTRLLYDAIDTNVDSYTFTDGTYTDNTSNTFAELWAALTKPAKGFRDTKFAFRNAGIMLLAQQWMQNNKASGGDSFASDWDQIRNLNRTTASTDHYAQYVIPTSGSCMSSPSYGPGSAYHFALTPTANADSNDGWSIDNGQLVDSNMFLNNRFYHLKIGGGSPINPGTHTLQLVYKDDDGSGTVTDLDLYLYNSSAIFALSSDIIRYSTQNPTGGAAATQNESMTVSLGAGDYLINVNVYTGVAVGAQTDYNLVLDGVVLCPADILQ